MLRKNLNRLKAYSLEQPPHRVKLNQNESPFDLPIPFKKKILAAMEALSWNRYPTPYADSLRAAIGTKEDWDPNGILVSGGSNVLVQVLMLAAAVKHSVVTVTPTFSLYEVEASLLENKVIRVPLSPTDFSLPLERFLKTVRQARPEIIFLANPNAPTGNLFPEEALLEIVKKSRCPVVIDEAYFPFSAATLKPYLAKFPQLMILRTLSKAFSLGGIRLGYLMAHRPMIDTVKKVMLPFTVGLLQEAIGKIVLENDSYVAEVVKTIARNREQLFAGLKKIPGITAYPSATNFILFKVADAKKTYADLVSKGVLVRPMGHGLKNCLRVSVGTEEENRLFLDSLR